MSLPSPHRARCSVCGLRSWQCPHPWNLRYAQEPFELGGGAVEPPVCGECSLQYDCTCDNKALGSALAPVLEPAPEPELPAPLIAYADGSGTTAEKPAGAGVVVFRGELVVPVGESGRSALKAFFAWRSKPRTACAEGWLLRRLHEACVKALVPECGLHDLRRAFATECHNAGRPLRVIQRWLGHKDLQTTERYIVTYRSDASLVTPELGEIAPAQSRAKAGVVSGRFESPDQPNGRSGRGGKA